MQRLTFRRFKLLTVVGVLAALLVGVGGWLGSQAANKPEGVQVLAYQDLVRFAVQDQQTSILRAEIFNLGGRRVFDSGPTIGISNQRSAISNQLKAIILREEGYNEKGDQSGTDQEVESPAGGD